MCKKRQCPKCNEITVYYNSYFNAFCCTRLSCGYFERKSEETPSASKTTLTTTIASKASAA